MSAQQCSQVWSEVLITAKGFRAESPAQQSRFRAVTLDYPKINGGPKIQAAEGLPVLSLAAIRPLTA
jgi:hypothetical protein